VLCFGAGDPRQVKLGDHEVIRRLYVAIRDRYWSTVLPVLTNVQMTVGDDVFLITYEAASIQDEIE
jgi:hypothetical protein